MALKNSTDDPMMEQEPITNSNASGGKVKAPLSFKEAVTGTIQRDVYFEDKNGPQTRMMIL